MLEGALATLQRRELIRESSRTGVRDFQFKHILTQEAAYNSLLLSRRRNVHRNVAQVLEAREPASIDAESNTIARHYIEAQEPARALPHLLNAADRAARAYAIPESLALYGRALDIARNTVRHSGGRMRL